MHNFFSDKHIYEFTISLPKINKLNGSAHETLGNLGLDATKPVFGVSDKANFKSVSSATATSYRKLKPVVSLDMILSKNE